MIREIPTVALGFRFGLGLVLWFGTLVCWWFVFLFIVLGFALREGESRSAPRCRRIFVAAINFFSGNRCRTANSQFRGSKVEYFFGVPLGDRFYKAQQRDCPAGQ